MAMVDELVGMTKDAAFDKIEAADMMGRIRSEDSKAFMGTCDWRTDRVNLHIEDGIVVKASIG
jgi:hypothetical protein